MKVPLHHLPHSSIRTRSRIQTRASNFLSRKHAHKGEHRLPRAEVVEPKKMMAMPGRLSARGHASTASWIATAAAAASQSKKVLGEFNIKTTSSLRVKLSKTTAAAATDLAREPFARTTSAMECLTNICLQSRQHVSLLSTQTNTFQSKALLSTSTNADKKGSSLTKALSRSRVGRRTPATDGQVVKHQNQHQNQKEAPILWKRHWMANQTSWLESSSFLNTSTFFSKESKRIERMVELENQKDLGPDNYKSVQRKHKIHRDFFELNRDVDQAFRDSVLHITGDESTHAHHDGSRDNGFPLSNLAKKYTILGTTDLTPTPHYRYVMLSEPSPNNPLQMARLHKTLLPPEPDDVVEDKVPVTRLRVSPPPKLETTPAKEEEPREEGEEKLTDPFADENKNIHGKIRANFYFVKYNGAEFLALKPSDQQTFRLAYLDGPLAKTTKMTVADGLIPSSALHAITCDDKTNTALSEQIQTHPELHGVRLSHSSFKAVLAAMKPGESYNGYWFDYCGTLNGTEEDRQTKQAPLDDLKALFEGGRGAPRLARTGCTLMYTFCCRGRTPADKAFVGRDGAMTLLTARLKDACRQAGRSLTVLRPPTVYTTMFVMYFYVD